MPTKPTIILATSNGVGMGHLARATAVARALGDRATPIIFSMASGVCEIPQSLGIRAEYVPGRDRGLMKRQAWDRYLAERLRALVDETGATIVTFDGVVPYPGFFQMKRWLPNVTLVWVRRGHWQRKPQRFVLGLQSRLMDYVIEPGDYSRAADTGPTSKRNDAMLVAPVSLYRKHLIKSREESAKLLGIDPNRPTVLVQLGTGDADVNSKLTAALRGLQTWKDLQIILTKKPIAKDGTSLVPAGMDYTLVRYFPLADVLSAFDAAIGAAGYNSVHEFLAAGIPTVLVSNNRGTDNQEARAKWCAENGYALYADQNDLTDIENTVAQLANPSVRASLQKKCHELPDPSGGNEIADCLLAISEPEVSSVLLNRLRHSRLIAQNAMSRGLAGFVKTSIGWGLQKLAVAYRVIFPHSKIFDEEARPEVVFSRSTCPNELGKLIKSDVLLEHLFEDASPDYEKTRREIAVLISKLSVVIAVGSFLIGDVADALFSSDLLLGLM